ncbi:MAG: CDP-alcohol phosphatidyltransferase family protein [Candidatus Marinimicrobia bacterium]|nr:CDP-alcohol phosphatidyltransferase family protein [Candidatus Neomarinimicrobiota bacterium]
MPDQNSKIKITDPTRIITLANLLSALRAFLTVPILYAMYLKEINIFLVLVAIAVATDYLDGYFARKANEVTELGKWLDPLADAIVIMSVMTFLAIDPHKEWDFPLWFVVFYLIRYLAIVLSSIYVVNHIKVSLSSNRLGKWAINFAALTILLFVLQNNDPYDTYVLWITTVLLVISGIQYFMTHWQVMHKK